MHVCITSTLQPHSPSETCTGTAWGSLLPSPPQSPDESSWPVPSQRPVSLGQTHRGALWQLTQRDTCMLNLGGNVCWSSSPLQLLLMLLGLDKELHARVSYRAGGIPEKQLAVMKSKERRPVTPWGHLPSDLESYSSYHWCQVWGRVCFAETV